MNLCQLNHVEVAPYYDSFVHSHNVASSNAGLIVDAFVILKLCERLKL